MLTAMPFRAQAKFRKEANVFLEFIAFKKELHLQVNQHHTVKRPHPWEARRGATKIADDAALRSAFVALCEEAERDGWTEYGHASTWRERTSPSAPKRPTPKDTEARLEALSDELATALVAAGGKRVAEKRALTAALESLGDLNEALDRNRLDFAVHFFAVDGVGLKKKRVPALQRPSVDDETRARWVALLEGMAQ
jgi:hypothetical protein